jgi:hypothetical protein
MYVKYLFNTIGIIQWYLTLGVLPMANIMTNKAGKEIKALNDAEVNKIIAEYFECSNGTKAAVFRYFILNGYDVKHCYNYLNGKKGFETLIYQHVRNEYQRLVKTMSKPKK